MKILNADTRQLFIGGIVAYNYGTIEQCSALLKVDTQLPYGYIGGIAGYNASKAVIKNSWASLENITTYGNVGGIAGENAGTIQNCSATGKINQTNYYYHSSYINTYIGGIVGKNTGEISNCHIGESDSYLIIKNCNSSTKDKYLAPYIGPIYGQNSGTVSGCFSNLYTIDTGNLQSFKVVFTTYNQKRNVNYSFN